MGLRPGRQTEPRGASQVSGLTEEAGRGLADGRIDGSYPVTSSDEFELRADGCVSAWTMSCVLTVLTSCCWQESVHAGHIICRGGDNPPSELDNTQDYVESLRTTAIIAVCTQHAAALFAPSNSMVHGDYATDDDNS